MSSERQPNTGRSIVLGQSSFQVLTGQVPYSQEAEEAVIGSVLINPDGFMEVSNFLQAEDFYILRHIYIWEALGRLYERRDQIDYLTLQVELQNMGRLNEIGGPAYLIQIINNTPTSMHCEIYGRLVERCAIRRRLLAAADEIKGLAMDEELAIEKVTADSEQALTAVTIRTEKRDRTFSDIMNAVLTEIEERKSDAEGNSMVGIPTLHDLDTIIGGVKRGDSILLAARPGQGKTSLLLSIGLKALLLNLRVSMFTQEMTADQVVQRMLSMESGIPLTRLITGQLSEPEWRRLIAAVDRIGKTSMNISDSRGMTIQDARKKSFRWARDTGIDLLLVDYLQLLTAATNNVGRRFEKRHEEVSFISGEIKTLAGDLNVPIISASQLSRDLETRKDKRPQLSDLRESGSLEQDADVVLFLYRDYYYNPASGDPNNAEIIIGKNRNGPTGATEVNFNGPTTKFSDKLYNRNLNLSAL